MYLVHIYSSFIFNLFLTFSFPLTFVYMFISFKLVLGHLFAWEDRVAVHVRNNILKSQMWQNSYIGEFL